MWPRGLSRSSSHSAGELAKSFGIDQAVAESTLHSESKLRRSGKMIPS